MAFFEDIQQILNRIEKGEQTDDDMTVLRQWLQAGHYQVVTQLGKYNVNIGEGKKNYIGDRIYQQWDEESIAALVKAIQQVSWRCVASFTENDFTQVEFNNTGIGIIDEFSKGIGELSKLMTDLSQQYVMRYGLKLAFSPNRNQEYFISGGDQLIKRWHKQRKTWEIQQ